MWGSWSDYIQRTFQSLMTIVRGSASHAVLDALRPILSARRSENHE
ncbi:hypothetical protein ALO36_103981 [Pseudomonas syringae pv. tomato]|nr:hypothetical protein ALO36_103981 [Pseudomonas syringae pv. tomato]